MKKVKEFKRLPGSNRQRNRARNLLKCATTPNGWEVYGGENTHLVVQIGTDLACDCDVYNKEEKICSHIIKVQMDLGIFPERGRYPS